VLEDAYSATWCFLVSHLIEHPVYLSTEKENVIHCEEKTSMIMQEKTNILSKQKNMGDTIMV